MSVIEKWGSSYVLASPNTHCCICGKPAQYVDVFSEQGICSFECAKRHNENLFELELKTLKENSEKE